MRALIALVVGAIGIAVGAPPVAADHCNGTGRDGDFGGTVAVQCEHKQSTGSSSRGSTYRPEQLIRTVSTVDGELCSILASRTSPHGNREVTTREVLSQFEVFYLNLGNVWRALVDATRHCAGAPTPEDIAYSFVHEAGAPGPSPYVAPGHAITGKPAYLETRGPTTHTQPFDTVLGPLTITFTAHDFTVDWGDGSGRDKGPFTAPGKPYPDGQARHVYTTKGAVDITITMRWTANWSVGGEAGAVEVTSTGRIEDLQVRQLQAVRKR